MRTEYTYPVLPKKLALFFMIRIIGIAFEDSFKVRLTAYEYEILTSKCFSSLFVCLCKQTFFFVIYIVKT